MQTTKLRPEWENSIGALATQSLIDTCLLHQGGSTYPIIDFLLSLYNGSLWKPDMQSLCWRIDNENFELVLEAMKFYRQTAVEPHMLFTHGHSLFEKLKTISSD